MYEDPVASVRRRFPTSAALPGMSSAALPSVPFAARFGVPIEIIEANGKHRRDPTRTTTSMPSQSTGDGQGKPPRPDDTVVSAND